MADRPANLPETRDGWAAFFGGFERVVLVANSDAVDIVSLSSRHGEGTLFVFFNKVFKVLDAPFARPSLLVARSSQAGANIVYRREVDDVLRVLRGDHFEGIANLRAGGAETFSPAEAFGGARVGFLDLAPIFADFYPDTHLPTSGFALAFWLAEACPTLTIVLAGFTAQRSARWKLFHDHEWTFEQIVNRLLVRSGRLEMDGGSRGGQWDRIAARLPGVTPSDVAVASAEVLSERLEGTNMTIDRLMSLTRLQSRIDSLLRGLKPKTRKQKLAEKTSSEAQSRT
ncbi:MAG TPA: 3-deoxy-manno-octulosonate cytidylyltransferase [Aurantimonas sp.]|uniref:3-deoxy-manno-octulosonate cytidylyltransferase n=1 Tax=Aurantimonas marianensis TaxID=2920428 RepID=A0A9X2HEP8_9HYPH|nr:3-deoxy-manno-octulosonate cytidylyltransferase [Aurantimonas marianensis]MCP3057077.1 3-deoxy-manno-octulosonate cytidylyltransferase [Aurantimonas marianensis]